MSDEEKEALANLEQKQFCSSVAMKTLSVFFFTHVRILWRPVGRPWLFDFMLLYFGSYAFLASNVPGVWQTWPAYRHLV